MSQPPSPQPSGYLQSLLSRPYLILTLTTLFWGGNVVAGKAAVGNVDPYALITLRWLGAFLAILPFALGPIRRDWPTLCAKWWLYLFYGAVGFTTFNVLVYVAAYFTSGVNNALDQVAINIFVMLFNFVLFRTRVRALQLAGVLITIAGVAVTATHGNLTRILSLDINVGDALVILASVAYAAYSIALRWRPATHWLSFLAASFLGAIIGAIVFQATLGGGLGALASAIPAITPLGWLIVLYTIFLPSIVSQILYVRGVELIGANRASLFINLIPLWGAIGSVLVLGEVVQPFHFVAGGLIVTGIVLAEWSVRSTP
jgi:drug/metabolite transporter (DMT)-like permease